MMMVQLQALFTNSDVLVDPLLQDVLGHPQHILI